MSLEELIVRQACGLPWRATAPGTSASGVMMIPIPEAGQLREVDRLPEARRCRGSRGSEISVALHHTVTPLPEGESYLGFIFARGETPAAVEESLREAHAKLRFTIVPGDRAELGRRAQQGDSGCLIDGDGAGCGFRWAGHKGGHVRRTQSAARRLDSSAPA